MLKSTQGAALLACLILSAAALVRVGPATAADPGDVAASAVSNGGGEVNLVQREKPEAGGRVIKRTQASRDDAAPQKTSAIDCKPEPKTPAHC